MNALILTAFFIVLAVIMGFQVRNIIRSNQQARNDLALDHRLEIAVGTAGNPELKSFLLSATFLALADPGNQHELTAIGFRAPESLSADPGNPPRVIEHEPAFLCFSSKANLRRFLQQPLGKLLSRNFTFHNFAGIQLFQTAQKRKLPVRLNAFVNGAVFKIFTVDEIDAILSNSQGAQPEGLA